LRASRKKSKTVGQKSTGVGRYSLMRGIKRLPTGEKV